MFKKESIKKYLIVLGLLFITIFYVFYNSEYAVTVSSEEIKDVMVSKVDIKTSKFLTTKGFSSDKHYVYLKSDDTVTRVDSMTLTSSLRGGDTIKAKVQTVKRLGFIEEDRIVPVLDENNFIVLR